MVKLTTELMTRGTSGHAKKKREESQNQFLSRLTHLYLEEKGIDDVENELGICRNLIVLYLYDNQLTKVPALHQNNNLTHLYLQNNYIRKIEGLSTLTQLTKLYLGGNAITVLEGIENLHLLQELHVENQQLPLGEKLLFDPRSLNSILQCIQVLNISGNNLDSIKELENARKLFHLMCSDNNINDLKELSHVLNRVTQLSRLDLIGNPICHKAKYRDRIIVMSKRLGMLDGKEITETSRQFLQNWQATKEAQKRKKEEMIKNGYSEASDLPPVKGLPNHASIPGYVMPGLPRKQFDQIMAKNSTSENYLSYDPTNPQKHILRANRYVDGYGRKINDISSAPIYRRPIMNVSIIDDSGKFKSSLPIASGIRRSILTAPSNQV